MSELPRWLRTLGRGVLVIGTAPLWLAFAALAGVVYLLWAGALYLMVWIWWVGPGRQRVLFVYSDSPHWKSHVETHVLPRLPGDAVVLNWSRRSTWPRFSLPVLLFGTFAGRREFNPIALVFARFALVERFRFWRPFLDVRHGKDGPLRRLEAELFERLETPP